jgi:phenylpyruvate tautomerase PptA (4-oxalocrotonate tautomerase family)
MPNVTIEWVEGRDRKTKAEVARKIVEVLDQVAGVPECTENLVRID